LFPEDNIDADTSDLEESDEQEDTGDESPVYDASVASSDSDVGSDDNAPLGTLIA
jgi:hypothetical protein